MKEWKCHVLIEKGSAGSTSPLMHSGQWWAQHFKKNVGKKKELLNGEGSRKHV